MPLLKIPSSFLDVLGKPSNESKAKTNKGVEFSIIDPQFIDIYEKIKRGAQIISLKDIGAIITEG